MFTDISRKNATSIPNVPSQLYGTPFRRLRHSVEDKKFAESWPLFCLSNDHAEIAQYWNW
jgi:hypothetical protein